MASQRAVEVVAEEASDDPTCRNVRLRLACGCEIRRTLSSERFIASTDGEVIVGKYPCPNGHPLVRV